MVVKFLGRLTSALFVCLCSDKTVPTPPPELYTPHFLSYCSASFWVSLTYKFLHLDIYNQVKE